ncbi:MAG TPA: glutamate racemase [Candidatus Saccharimonadales bacterium]|nr:glutamate racemase [Candidatus Saccharimonadales bacterium]
MKIGVFDSGIGGLSVARAIQKALPDAEVIFKDDHQHMPYGDKPSAAVLSLVEPILQALVRQGCQVIVIACNTVTTTLITQLRERIAVPLIGVEPMVKSAAATTKTGVIAVCATPATLSSARYAWLKQSYAQGVRVLEPDCSQWARMIEHNQISERQIAQEITTVCDQGADVIVLGCTHYHWIEELVQRIAAERAVVIQPEQPVIQRLRRVLQELGEL